MLDDRCKKPQRVVEARTSCEKRKPIIIAELVENFDIMLSSFIRKNNEFETC